MQYRLNADAAIRCVTEGQPHSFFGYYDKNQWDLGGRLLTMQAAFEGRPVAAGDILQLGVIDLEHHASRPPVGETRAWCWQQGCMLQWLPGSSTRHMYMVDISGFLN